MATKFTPPAPPFIAARFHGGSQTPKAIVMHATVSPDTPGMARQIANWWHGSTSPVTSAHYVVDPKETIQCVGDHTIAYHCGYNTGSISIEMCDEQTGPASRWNDANSTAIMQRAARLVAELCLAYGIAVKRPTVAQLKAKGPHGIYGHNDSRLAFGHTTHSDPRDFKWAKFMKMVRSEVKAIKNEANKASSGKHNTKRQPIRVNVTHSSQQFSDGDKAHAHDAEAVFNRAKQRNVRWMTGTEAGPGAGNNLRKYLKAAAKKYGYKIWIKGDIWIAVQKSAIKKGSFKHFWRAVVPGVARKWTTKGVASVTWQDKVFGQITVIGGHYLTKGRPGAKNPIYAQHVPQNRAIAKAIGDYARKMGKGSNLVFYGGDQNIVDRTGDTFFSEPLTSLWDELHHYENTGHGNIDVIASYDKDGRVSAGYCRALNDKEFYLYTDHFLVEGGFDILPLKKG